MMHNSRFSFGDDDRRLLDNCDQLNIKLYRDEEDGKVSCYFELHGCVRSSDEDDDTQFMPKSDMSFVRDLIEKFEKVKD